MRVAETGGTACNIISWFQGDRKMDVDKSGSQIRHSELLCVENVLLNRYFTVGDEKMLKFHQHALIGI